MWHPITGGIWHWLTSNGLYSALVSWTVFSLMTLIFITWIGKSIRRYVHQQREILRNQRLIADRLDTRSPGGLSDVVQALQRPEDGSQTPSNQE